MVTRAELVIDRTVTVVDHGNFLTVFEPMAAGVDVYAQGELLVCEAHPRRTCRHIQRVQKYRDAN